MRVSFQKSVVSSFVLVTFLCFTQFSSISCDDKKVSLALYYESLCPGCSNFIVNYLPKIFKNGIIDIVDLKLVPWGNTRILANNTFICQHGPYECLLDTVEACVLDAWPHLNEYFPFIYCVESLVYHENYTQWETCFDKLSLKLITDCVGSDRGKELELRLAAETPPHKYVPWVVVDGQPLYDDIENFISYICKAYKGTAPIRGCSSSNSLSFTSKLSTITPAITSFVEQS